MTQRTHHGNKAGGAGGPRRGKGFRRTSALLSARIREAGESRGFAVSKVLTHWAEIAGAEIARISRPVNVSYGRGGMGATLTVLTTGAQAPMLEMQKERLRERVNSCYGYNAIARIRITQTAPTGFDEGQRAFAAPAHRPEPPAPDPAADHAARELAAPVSDPGLRDALEALGRNVTTRNSTKG